MQIGIIIKKLRKEKDITQEQLAEYLGISSRAISQWETCKTMPDISQLPVLANIFNVTTDYLLGVNIREKDKRVNEILETAAKHWSKGGVVKGAEILREGLKEFPNNHKIMLDLMSCIWRVRDFPENRQKRDFLTQEVINLGEKIIEESTDAEIRDNAIILLCYTYSDFNQTDKAIELAEKMPDRYSAKEHLLKGIYKGTKRFDLLRNDLWAIISDLYNDMLYNCGPLDNGSRPYNSKEMLQIHDKYLKIMETFFEDENFGFFGEAVALANLYAAVFCMRVNNYERAIFYLKSASQHAIVYDNNYDPDDEYTCLLFRGMKFGGVLHNTNKNLCMQIVNVMQNPDFDKIRDNDEFCKILKELEKHAGVRDNG